MFHSWFHQEWTTCLKWDLQVQAWLMYIELLSNVWLRLYTTSHLHIASQESIYRTQKHHPPIPRVMISQPVFWNILLALQAWIWMMESVSDVSRFTVLGWAARCGKPSKQGSAPGKKGEMGWQSTLGKISPLSFSSHKLPEQPFIYYGISFSYRQHALPTNNHPTNQSQRNREETCSLIYLCFLTQRTKLARSNEFPNSNYCWQSMASTVLAHHLSSRLDPLTWEVSSAFLVTVGRNGETNS